MMLRNFYDLLQILLKQKAKSHVKRQRSKLLIYDEYLKEFVSADKQLVPCVTKDIIKGVDSWEKSKDFMLFDLLLKKFINPNLDLLSPPGLNVRSTTWRCNSIQGCRYASTAKDFWESGPGSNVGKLPALPSTSTNKDEPVLGWAGQVLSKPKSNPRPEQSTTGPTNGPGGNVDTITGNPLKGRSAMEKEKSNKYGINLAKSGALLYEGKTERKIKSLRTKSLKLQKDVKLQNKSKSKLRLKKSSEKHDNVDQSIDVPKEAVAKKVVTDAIKKEEMKVKPTKREKGTMLKKIYSQMFLLKKTGITVSEGKVNKESNLKKKSNTIKDDKLLNQTNPSADEKRTVNNTTPGIGNNNLVNTITKHQEATQSKTSANNAKSVDKEALEGKLVKVIKDCKETLGLTSSQSGKQDIENKTPLKTKPSADEKRTVNNTNSGTGNNKLVNTITKHQEATQSKTSANNAKSVDKEALESKLVKIIKDCKETLGLTSSQSGKQDIENKTPLKTKPCADEKRTVNNTTSGTGNNNLVNTITKHQEATQSKTRANNEKSVDKEALESKLVKIIKDCKETLGLTSFQSGKQDIENKTPLKTKPSADEKRTVNNTTSGTGNNNLVNTITKHQEATQSETRANNEKSVDKETLESKLVKIIKDCKETLGLTSSQSGKQDIENKTPLKKDTVTLSSSKVDKAVLKSNVLGNKKEEIVEGYKVSQTLPKQLDEKTIVKGEAFESKPTKNIQENHKNSCNLSSSKSDTSDIKTLGRKSENNGDKHVKGTQNLTSFYSKKKDAQKSNLVQKSNEGNKVSNKFTTSKNTEVNKNLGKQLQNKITASTLDVCNKLINSNLNRDKVQQVTQNTTPQTLPKGEIGKTVSDSSPKVKDAKDTSVSLNETNIKTEKVKDDIKTKNHNIEPKSTKKLHEISAQGKLLENIALEEDLSQYNVPNYKGFKINLNSITHDAKKNFPGKSALENDLESSSSQSNRTEITLGKHIAQQKLSELKNSALQKSKNHLTKTELQEQLEPEDGLLRSRSQSKSTDKTSRKPTELKKSIRFRSDDSGNLNKQAAKTAKPENLRLKKDVLISNSQSNRTNKTLGKPKTLQSNNSRAVADDSKKQIIKIENRAEVKRNIDPKITEKLHEISAQGKLLDELALEGDIGQYNIENYKGFKTNSKSDTQIAKKNLSEQSDYKEHIERSTSHQKDLNKTLGKPMKLKENRPQQSELKVGHGKINSQSKRTDKAIGESPSFKSPSELNTTLIDPTKQVKNINLQKQTTLTEDLVFSSGQTKNNVLEELKKQATNASKMESPILKESLLRISADSKSTYKTTERPAELQKSTELKSIGVSQSKIQVTKAKLPKQSTNNESAVRDSSQSKCTEETFGKAVLLLKYTELGNNALDGSKAQITRATLPENLLPKENPGSSSYRSKASEETLLKSSVPYKSGTKTELRIDVLDDSKNQIKTNLPEHPELKSTELRNNALNDSINQVVQHSNDKNNLPGQSTDKEASIKGCLSKSTDKTSEEPIKFKNSQFRNDALDDSKTQVMETNLPKKSKGTEGSVRDGSESKSTKKTFEEHPALDKCIKKKSNDQSKELVAKTVFFEQSSLEKNSEKISGQFKSSEKILENSSGLQKPTDLKNDALNYIKTNVANNEELTGKTMIEKQSKDIGDSNNVVTVTVNTNDEIFESNLPSNQNLVAERSIVTDKVNNYHLRNKTTIAVSEMTTNDDDKQDKALSTNIKENKGKRTDEETLESFSSEKNERIDYQKKNKLGLRIKEKSNKGKPIMPSMFKHSIKKSRIFKNLKQIEVKKTIDHKKKKQSTNNKLQNKQLKLGKKSEKLSEVSQKVSKTHLNKQQRSRSVPSSPLKQNVKKKSEKHIIKTKSEESLNNTMSSNKVKSVKQTKSLISTTIDQSLKIKELQSKVQDSRNKLTSRECEKQSFKSFLDRINLKTQDNDQKGKKSTQISFSSVDASNFNQTSQKISDSLKNNKRSNLSQSHPINKRNLALKKPKKIVGIKSSPEISNKDEDSINRRKKRLNVTSDLKKKSGISRPKKPIHQSKERLFSEHQSNSGGQISGRTQKGLRRKSVPDSSPVTLQRSDDTADGIQTKKKLYSSKSGMTFSGARSRGVSNPYNKITVENNSPKNKVKYKSVSKQDIPKKNKQDKNSSHTQKLVKSEHELNLTEINQQSIKNTGRKNSDYHNHKIETKKEISLSKETNNIQNVKMSKGNKIKNNSNEVENFSENGTPKKMLNRIEYKRGNKDIKTKRILTAESIPQNNSRPLNQENKYKIGEQTVSNKKKQLYEDVNKITILFSKQQTENLTEKQPLITPNKQQPSNEKNKLRAQSANTKQVEYVSKAVEKVETSKRKTKKDLNSANQSNTTTQSKMNTPTETVKGNNKEKNLTTFQKLQTKDSEIKRSFVLSNNIHLKDESTNTRQQYFKKLSDKDSSHIKRDRPGSEEHLKKPLMQGSTKPTTTTETERNKTDFPSIVESKYIGILKSESKTLTKDFKDLRKTLKEETTTAQNIGDTGNIPSNFHKEIKHNDRISTKNYIKPESKSKETNILRKEKINTKSLFKDKELDVSPSKVDLSLKLNIKGNKLTLKKSDHIPNHGGKIEDESFKEKFKAKQEKEDQFLKHLIVGFKTGTTQNGSTIDDTSDKVEIGVETHQNSSFETKKTENDVKEYSKATNKSHFETKDYTPEKLRLMLGNMKIESKKKEKIEHSKPFSEIGREEKKVISLQKAQPKEKLEDRKQKLSSLPFKDREVDSNANIKEVDKDKKDSRLKQLSKEFFLQKTKQLSDNVIQVEDTCQTKPSDQNAIGKDVSNDSKIQPIKTIDSTEKNSKINSSRKNKLLNLVDKNVSKPLTKGTKKPEVKPKNKD